MGRVFFDRRDKSDFERYKERLLANKGNFAGIERVMQEAEQCAELTQDEYEKLCDIANGCEKNVPACNEAKKSPPVGDPAGKD